MVCRPQRWLVAVASVALGAVAWPACDADPEPAAPAPFVEALPDAPLLLLAFPDALGVVPIEGPARFEATARVGDRSELHAASRATAGVVNRALQAMTAPLARARGGLTPRREGPDRVVWEGALEGDPDLHRLVVERTEDGRFAYRLGSRDRVDADAPWRARIAGETTQTAGARGRGRGVVWVDLDGDRAPESEGKAVVLWSDVDGRREVDVSFIRATPDGGAGPARTLRFVYGRGPLGGRMAFGPQAMNVHEREDRPLLEEVTILSRWDALGAGRTDVTARGGDLRLDEVAVRVRSECWGPPPELAVVFAASYARRVGQTGLSAIAPEGDAEACAFGAPELATVPPVEAEPEPR